MILEEHRCKFLQVIKMLNISAFFIFPKRVTIFKGFSNESIKICILILSLKNEKLCKSYAYVFNFFFLLLLYFIIFFENSISLNKIQEHRKIPPSQGHYHFKSFKE